MSRPTPRMLAAVAAASLLLAGCGVSRPTKTQYTARANAICRTASSKTTPLIEQLMAAAESLSVSAGGESVERQLASALQQLHPDAASALTQLRALEQPAAGRTAIERFLTPFASVTDGLRQAATAAAAGERQKALTELENVASDSVQMTSAAKAYGMTQCERVLAALGSTGYLHPIYATLVGENHDPTVNQPWTYTVTVTNAQGQKLSGTETTEYTYNGVVVGTEKPENVKFTGGVYHDTVEFPAAAVGHPLDVQAVVHVSLGSVTLDWPIEVKH